MATIISIHVDYAEDGHAYERAEFLAGKCADTIKDWMDDDIIKGKFLSWTFRDRVALEQALNGLEVLGITINQHLTEETK